VDSPYYSEPELCGGAVTLVFEVPPLASDALLTTLHPLLENVLQTVCRKLQEDSGRGGAPFPWSEKLRNRMGARSGLYGGCSNGVPQIHFFQAQHRIQSHTMRFLGFSNRGKRAPRQEISKWLTIRSTFSISGWSVVRSVSLAKGGTSKKRPSPQLHKVPTRSNKVSPRNLQMALV
jgi:hypothetical protein